MYNYDYRSYFQSIISDMDILQSNQSQQYTELQQLNDNVAALTDAVVAGLGVLTAIIVLSCVIKVMFTR